MSDLSDKVYSLLINENINNEDMIMTLKNIQSEIDEKLWEKINISPLIFFKLKDTIFYNFEYCHYNNVATGKTTLKDFGKNYPLFMYNINDSTYILHEDIQDLMNELEDIKRKWNANIYTANIYTKTDFSWNVGDDNPSPLIIYNEQNETPMKYGFYNNSYSNILDSAGNNMQYDNNIVLCSIKQIDIYREYNLLTQTLDNLYNIMNNALRNNKGIYIDMNDHEYNYEK